MLAYLPFGRDSSRRAGVPVEWVGHPLLSAPSLRRDVSRWVVFDPAKPTVALLPGSRINEVRAILPGLLDAARRIHGQLPAVQFLLARVRASVGCLLASKDAVQQSPCSRTRPTRCSVRPMSRCSRPGSSRSQTAFASAPIIRRCSAVTADVSARPSVSHVNAFAMAELLAGHQVVPELVQDDSLRMPSRGTRSRSSRIVAGQTPCARSCEPSRRSWARRVRVGGLQRPFSPLPRKHRATFGVDCSHGSRDSFVASVLVTSVASATVLVPADFSEMVGGSQIIAYARVVDVRPEWAEGRRSIDSVVTADVVSYLKGGPEETITFKVPGGRLGRYRSVVVGAPVFARGDEAVLFLSPTPRTARACPTYSASTRAYSASRSIRGPGSGWWSHRR